MKTRLNFVVVIFMLWQVIAAAISPSVALAQEPETELVPIGFERAAWTQPSRGLTRPDPIPVVARSTQNPAGFFQNYMENVLVDADFELADEFLPYWATGGFPIIVNPQEDPNWPDDVCGPGNCALFGGYSDGDGHITDVIVQGISELPSMGMGMVQMCAQVFLAGGIAPQPGVLQIKFEDGINATPQTLIWQTFGEEAFYQTCWMVNASGLAPDGSAAFRITFDGYSNDQLAFIDNLSLKVLPAAPLKIVREQVPGADVPIYKDVGLTQPWISPSGSPITWPDPAGMEHVMLQGAEENIIPIGVTSDQPWWETPPPKYQIFLSAIFGGGGGDPGNLALSVPKSLQGYINPDDLGPYTIKDLVIEEQQVVSSGKPDTVCSAQIIPAGRGWPGVIEAWEGIQLDWIGAFEFKGHGPCSGQYHIDVVNGSLLGAFYCPHLGEMQLTLLDSSDTTFPRYMNFASLHANDPFRVAVEQANDELLRREEQFVTTGGKVVGIVVLGGALFIITPGLPDEVLLLAALKGATSLPKDPGGSEANLCVGFPPQ